MLAVRNGRPKGPAQSLHLVLTHRGSQPVTGATVTVRGLTARGRVARALADPDPVGQKHNADAARALAVIFVAGPNGEVSADLRVPDLTAVLAIDLDSLTYADGSTWKLSPGKTCRTVPDPLMLVVQR